MNVIFDVSKLFYTWRREIDLADGSLNLLHKLYYGLKIKKQFKQNLSVILLQDFSITQQQKQTTKEQM